VKLKCNRQKGFTLIEVIVVAVFVLILAAVGIPMYNGFIMTERQNVVDNLAETAAAAANVHYRRTLNDPDPKTLISVSGHNVTIVSDKIRVEEKKTANGGRCGPSEICKFAERGFKTP